VTDSSTPDRIDVTFASQGLQCSAWLYRPGGVAEPPVIVMAHGLGGTREMRLDAFAERFQAAGYAALVFDYRHFGESEGEPRRVVDIRKQRADWRAAIAHVRSRQDVDPGRVILWGSSLSGGHVIATAAQDPGISAAMAQGPFTSGISSSLAMHPLSALKVGPRAMADQVGSYLGRGPVYIPAIGKPGELGLLTSPDSVPGVMALVPEGSTFDNRLSARFGSQILFDHPGRQAKKVRCPLLVAVCDKDTVCPPGPTRRYAAQAPRGEVRDYPFGHFDIYVGEAFETAVADQLEFLARHVPTEQNQATDPGVSAPQ
jgi:dienelactone hydrolase